MNWIKLDWDEKTGTNMSAHEREKHLHFLPGGSDRRSFLRPGFNPPLKAKSWLGAWRHVSMCSSGLSTLNNRVGIIHILHSSRFTTLHLTLNRNQLFESHYSINPLYKKRGQIGAKKWPQMTPQFWIEFYPKCCQSGSVCCGPFGCSLNFRIWTNKYDWKVAAVSADSCYECSLILFCRKLSGFFMHS